MNTKNYLFFIVILIILITILTVIPYVYYFWGYTISTDPKDWGPFGDYIGGILNPILSCFNLILLIWTTFKIANLQSELELRIAKDNSDLQKTITKINIEAQQKIAIWQIRNESYLALMSQLDDTVLNSNSGDEVATFQKATFYVTTFINNCNHLFPSINNSDNGINLEKTLNKITNSYINKINTPYPFDQWLSDYKSFLSAKFIFSTELQNEIMNGLK